MPKVPYGTELQFTLFSFIIFISVFIEPNSLRPSYFKTLNDISGGRLVQITISCDILRSYISKIYDPR